MSTVRVGSTFPVEGVTVEQVFDYLDRIENAAEWNTFVQSAESPDPSGEGRRIDLRIGFLGITFPAHAVVTVSERPNRSVIEGRRPFPSEIGMELDEADDGVAVTGWFEMSPGRFFPVPKFVLKGAVQKQYDRDTDLLRQRLEELAD